MLRFGGKLKAIPVKEVAYFLCVPGSQTTLMRTFDEKITVLILP
ncbi:MAG: hypothetical protein R3B47_21525 [Bacteroidia bacterium]